MKKNLFYALIAIAIIAAPMLQAAGQAQPSSNSSKKGCSGCSNGGCCGKK